MTCSFCACFSQEAGFSWLFFRHRTNRRLTYSYSFKERWEPKKKKKGKKPWRCELESMWENPLAGWFWLVTRISSHNYFFQFQLEKVFLSTRNSGSEPFVPFLRLLGQETFIWPEQVILGRWNNMWRRRKKYFIFVLIKKFATHKSWDLMMMVVEKTSNSLFYVWLHTKRYKSESRRDKKVDISRRAHFTNQFYVDWSGYSACTRTSISKLGWATFFARLVSRGLNFLT